MVHRREILSERIPSEITKRWRVRKQFLEELCNCHEQHVWWKKKQNRFQLSKRSSRAYIVFPLRGSIVVELLNEIEYAAKECYNKDSVLAQKDFCDLAEFKWHELIDELLEQQPLRADVLLAVSLPTSKIGNTKSVQRLTLVISTVFGMLMNTGYQELSLQLVSSKDNRNDFS
ncbi:hypothetical protein DPMN_119238 [Dreissena polymorpha]|uniref:Uncharacterized protein n=1 Tax=Dreissena polymorpha TaxID=45954 RepID=A0A9D4JR25_DREPO|nr:hypothetical protein DPMN_119238 [Dreissena polymorpha]